MRFFRVRVVVEATAPVRLHAQHGAAIYAWLAAAAGQERKGAPGLPDGLMIDAPEQCRVRIEPGEPYAFGFTLLDTDGNAAAGVLRTLVDGLAVLAATPLPGTPAWGGNYRLVGVSDLVTGAPWGSQQPLTPISVESLDDEAEQLARLDRVTLRFTTPLRRRRLADAGRPGHAYLDHTRFDAPQFAGALWTRLAGLGLTAGTPPTVEGLTCDSNRLVWLDFSYGPAAERTRLGGAVGRITLAGPIADWAKALVLGQYARVGSNTRFGFGAYRVEELGPERFPCRRALGLLDLALERPALDRLAEQAELPAGRLGHLAGALRDGTYEPGPSAIVEVRDGADRARRLAIPPVEDRVLQRAVVERLAPGLDPFLEDSSFAYRRGLSRHSAAKALASAWGAGFRWAVRADVHRFFDAIDHDALRDRLEAYLADDPLTDRLLAWVRAGAPEPGRGVPTGAPLSPLLANLFLDGFDERVAEEGGRLVRYADDLLILCRTRAEAEQRLDAARAAASALALALNEEKTEVVALTAPFTFLGFRFEWRQRWEIHPDGGATAIEELGWNDARRPFAGPVVVRLPGETQEPANDGTLLVAGPGRYPVTLHGERVVCGAPDDARAPMADPARCEAVVLLGDPDIAAPALRALAAGGAPVFVTDALLRDPIALVADAAPDDPAAIAGQLRLADDEARRLALARAVIAAKLSNHAVLADAVPARDGPETATGIALRALAERAAVAADFPELLGLEGAGARLWFSALADRLPPGWHFSHRVAPNADDPVNVLLNMAQTHMHRWACLAVRAAGLLPSIGFFHRPRPGHAALASDLQEPFRHLMDRAVLELSARLRPTDFRATPRGRFPLTILPHASQQVAAALASTLHRGVELPGESEPRSYRRHLFGLARALRRSLADPTVPWPVFHQPSVPGGPPS